MKELMIHVERAVRPVRASAACKLRMREELLVHLISVYEEERSRAADDAAALAAAVQRFGDPAELTRELQASLGVEERFAHWLESWFGRRPADTPARYMLRLTSRVLVFCLVLYAGMVVSLLLAAGGEFAVAAGLSLAARMRLGAVMLLMGCVDFFLFGLLYFRMRAALGIGPVGRRSWRAAAACAGLCVLAVLASGMVFTLLAVGSVSVSLELIYLWLPYTVLVPVGIVIWGLRWGPREVRQLEWMSLDIS